MRRLVLFVGGKEEVRYISDQEAESVERSLQKSAQGFVKIGGDVIKKNTIKAIMADDRRSDDLPRIDNPNRAIAAGKRCTGTRSIQSETNRIIREEYPDDWPKRIGKKSERAQIQKILRQGDSDWCDYLLGRCVCNG